MSRDAPRGGASARTASKCCITCDTIATSSIGQPGQLHGYYLGRADRPVQYALIQQHIQQRRVGMVNGRTFALGAIGGAGVPVQVALAGWAVVSTGSAAEASRSGIV